MNCFVIPSTHTKVTIFRGCINSPNPDPTWWKILMSIHPSVNFGHFEIWQFVRFAMYFMSPWNWEEKFYFTKCPGNVRMLGPNSVNHWKITHWPRLAKLSWLSKCEISITFLIVCDVRERGTSPLRRRPERKCAIWPLSAFYEDPFLDCINDCLCWSLCPHTSHHYLLLTLLCNIRRVIHPMLQDSTMYHKWLQRNASVQYIAIEQSTALTQWANNRHTPWWWYPSIWTI